ncbi:MAG TPA: diaminopimelate decarboxylase [Bacillota bacterium]
MEAYWGAVRYDRSRGRLQLGDADAVTLASAYGTPLLVLNETIIREHCRRYRQAFRDAGAPSAEVAYAGKAFLTIAMCQLLDEEGLSLDVVSGGELYTALSAGFPPERILFHGNNKSVDELEQALSAGVGRIVVDNFAELERLERLVAPSRRARVLLRVVPGVEAHTHAYIETGKQDTKFGFDIACGQALEAVERTLAIPGLELVGLHCHIGSQIFEIEPYRKAIERVYAFLDEVERRCGIILPELDFGGGLGVRYLPEDAPPSIEALVAALVAEVRRQAEERGWPLPHLLVEPGRSIVCEAGVTLYEVGSIKRLPGVRTYVAVNGGMMENPRPALYDARYTALLVPGAGSTPLSERPLERVAIVGRACESGDVLVREIELPRPEVGDLVALLSTGAYTYSMAGHYNKFPRPAVVLLEGSKARIIVEREHYHDLIRHERPLRAAAKVASTPTRAARRAAATEPQA